MGGADQLHVSRAGGSRQRSMTPNTEPSPPIHVRSHSSSTPMFNTKWSSRVEREVPLPAGNQPRPAWNHDPGSFRSQTEVRLHLDPTESGAETGGEENTARTARSSVFLLSNEKAGIHRPEFSTGTFQEGPPLHRLSPSGPFNAKPASSSSFQTSFDHGPVSTAATAMWKPASWSPPGPPSSRQSGSPLSSRPRPAARTPGPDEDAKENIFPAVVRSNNEDVRTTTTMTTNYFASQIKPPTVWQPSAVPQKSSSSSTTNPSAVRSAASPLAEVNFLLGTETRRGWENNARADEEKKGFDLPPNVNKILAPSNEYDRDAELSRDKDKSE